ncbi:MAG: hypothetical protein ACRC8K_13130 [Waterburya sp.]
MSDLSDNAFNSIDDLVIEPCWEINEVEEAGTRHSKLKALLYKRLRWLDFQKIRGFECTY